MDSDFEKHLRFDRRMAESTIYRYRTALKEFKKFRNKIFQEYVREDFRDFIEHLELRGMSNSTISNYIIIFRSHWNWLADATRNPEIMSLAFFLAKMVKVRRDNPITQVPTPEEVIQLRKVLEAHKVAFTYNKASSDYKKILRDTAIIELLITSGIRSKELRDLKLSDVLLEEKIIMVRAGKGEKQRLSLFSPSAEKALKEYFDHNNFDLDDHIFPVKYAHNLNYIIHYWADKANINNKIHAHSFRHYFITEAQRQGVSIEHVADQVGHVSLNTTRRYTHLNIQNLKEKFKKINI